MKTIKLLLVIAVCFGIFCSLASTGLAGGAGAENTCCVKEDKNLGGTTPLKTTVAVHYVDNEAPSGSGENVTDATIRIERSGQQKAYRVRIVGDDITGDSDEGIFCKLFNPCVWGPGSDNLTAVNRVVNEILKDFFDIDYTDPEGDPAGQLLLSDKSISDTDWTGNEFDRMIYGAPGVFMSIANASVYVELY